MTAWYRNESWSEEISADFERRLARSRHQKAQNLTLQGFHLIARHPMVARKLLQRAVTMEVRFETQRALSFLAMANLALGKVDEALEAYEAALGRQGPTPASWPFSRRIIFLSWVSSNAPIASKWRNRSPTH